MAFTPFDWLNSINTTKVDMREKEPIDYYNAFMINRGLSYFTDTILYAAEMNLYPGLPKDAQYDFYMTAIPKRKRFTKWAKSKKKNEDIELIQKFFGFSLGKATVAYKILSETQLEEIRSSFNTGG